MLSAIFLIDIMSNATMGVSKVCSLGNKVDVDECDVLEYLFDDPDTGVIGLYLESFSDGRRFLDLCRRSAKPIVVLKGGRSRQGAEAALSHTASLAGNQRIVTGALAQAGVTEARDFKQMMDLCRSLALMKPAHRRVGPGRRSDLERRGGDRRHRLRRGAGACHGRPLPIDQAIAGNALPGMDAGDQSGGSLAGSGEADRQRS